LSADFQSSAPLIFYESHNVLTAIIIVSTLPRMRVLSNCILAKKKKTLTAVAMKINWFEFGETCQEFLVFFQ
jgi:hypothetical protein